MTLVRIDLQLTEAEAHEVATLLASRLGGFKAAFDQMIANGTAPGTHYAMLYRSKDAEERFRAEGL